MMIIFRRLALGFGISTLAATTAVACPWASTTHSATVPPDITITVTFNAKCSAARLTDSGGKARDLAVKATKKGWQVKYDSTTIVFAPDGKTAQGRRGGAQRNLRLKKL